MRHQLFLVRFIGIIVLFENVKLRPKSFYDNRISNSEHLLGSIVNYRMKYPKYVRMNLGDIRSTFFVVTLKAIQDSEITHAENKKK